jgi:hypothetical protein
MGYRHTAGYKKARCSRQEGRKGKNGSGLMSAQKEQNWGSRVGPRTITPTITLAVTLIQYSF